ncbi:MAG: phosphopantetheine-binding protein [Gaiellaceae bacterium]
MPETDLAALLSSVTTWVEQKSAQLNGEQTSIGPQTDLLGDGLLDSLAFIELIAQIEEFTGRQLDLLEIDPDAFTTVDGLCRFALSEPATAEAESAD